jgi:hypothetical protein
MIATLLWNGLTKICSNYRMQRGGFDLLPIKDSDFKYTIDTDRKLWTKNVFPIAEYIIQAIQNIPWSTYSFDAISYLWKPSGRTFESEQIDLATYPLEAGESRYYYFGGSVYEIMNRLYNRTNMPNLHTYVDPTGDLDVMLILPRLHLRGGKSLDRYLAYFFHQLPYEHQGRQASPQAWGAPVVSANGNRTNNNTNNNNNNNHRANKPLAEPPEILDCPNEIFSGANATQETVVRDPRRYTRLIEDYTDWVMDEFAKNLKKYKRGGLFDLLFGNTIPFNLENDAEGRYADRILCIGNLKLVRSYLPYMGLIKIQLIARFTGMKRSDHICEFLLDMPYKPGSHLTLRDYEAYEHKFHILKGYPLSNFAELVRGNIDSLINRYALFNGDLRHKFYNHVGRMQYLHDFFKNNLNPYYEDDNTKLTLRKKNMKELMVQMAKFSFYAAENFFSTDILDFNYKKLPNSLSPEQVQLIRIAILNSLIGSYPTFLMQKFPNGKYKSPVVKAAYFRNGDVIPARTKFELIEMFDEMKPIPRTVLYMEARIQDKNELNIVQLFLLLRYLNLVKF